MVVGTTNGGAAKKSAIVGAMDVVPSLEKALYLYGLGLLLLALVMALG